MNTSELITDQHRARKAIIYIRQSSPHQVLTHQESTRLQYALQQRAQSLGWRFEDIEVIDTDLGLNANGVQHRVGFKELAAQVTLGQVGIILSTEVTRLSRNCSDWYPLLDICGYKGCLIADRDGIYDPGSLNGRLLLGLKGQLSEMERYTIRARMTDGLLNKAARGELAIKLPVGFVRDEHGVVSKDPDQEVQHHLGLIFDRFLQLRSASQVVRFFLEKDLLIPRRNLQGDLVWRKPTVVCITATLKNPAYAGMFVYGRSRVVRKDPSSPQKSQKHLPMGQWKFCVPDKYPAYISWDTFVKIQAMLKDNYAEYQRNQARGVPRPGAALLQGLVYCGECGHKMVIIYKRGTRYVCNHLQLQYGVRECQRVPADPIDARVVAAFFEALTPVELDGYTRAMAAKKQAEEEVERAHTQQLERLRYRAALAERQYNRVDPDNRLIAAELEKRWETALRDLRQAEEAYAVREQTPEIPFTLSAELKAAFSDVGKRLPEIWQAATLTRQHKKALLRCLIDKVVLHRLARDQVQTRIVWKGGETTTLQIPVAVRSLAHLSSAQDLEQRILQMAAEGKSDPEIAQQVTAQGYRSAMQPYVSPHTVQAIRLKHRVFVVQRQWHPRQIPGYLTVPQVSQALNLPPHWIYDRIHNGSLQVHRDPKTRLYLFPDKPSTLERLRQLRSGRVKNLRF